MAKVKIYETIRKCPGGFHSWVRSSVGVIRKPNNKVIYNIKELPQEPGNYEYDQPIENKPKESLWVRFWRYIRSKFKTA